MRSVLTIFLFAFTLMALFPEEGRASGPSPTTKLPAKILAIHSYSHTYAWTEAQHHGFLDTLTAKFGGQIDLKSEFLDTKRKELSRPYGEKFVQFIREKYQGYNPDAIYVTDDNGLIFAMQYLSQIFPDVPIFFSGVNDYSQLDRLDKTHVTGVFEKKTIQPNLSLLGQLTGNVEKIIIVGDGSPTYRAIKAELTKELSASQGPKVTFIADHRMGVILDKITQLAPQPVILSTLGAVRDQNGEVLSLNTVVSKLVETQHKIIITMEDAYLFDGVLGGYLTSGRAQGKAAAQLMIKYLSGVSISDLPPVVQSPNEYIFNDQMLKKLKLELPGGITERSRLINPRVSFFSAFGAHIIVAVIVLAGALAATLLAYLVTLTTKNRQLTEQGDRLRHSETSLQLETKLLADVGRISKTGGWQYDLESNELKWSVETRRIHEVDDDYIPIVEEAIEFYKPEDREEISAAVEAGLNGGDPWDLELSIITAKGNHKYVRAMGETVFKDGKPSVLLGVFHDITERKLAEEVVRSAFEEVRLANQAKSEFLAAMSHEFRTPLNAILGFAEILSRQYLGPIGLPKYQEYANDIFSSGEHLLSLVNEVLDISAIEAGKRNLRKELLKGEDILEECKNIITREAQAKNITITSEIDGAMPPVYADALAIRQILLNLLTNAIKFTASGGRIQISATANETETVFIVSDSGVGIAQEIIPELTNPFTRGERDPHKSVEGWGLGLAISKSLVDLHHGKLSIESKVGFGTTVTIVLPAAGKAIESPTKEA